MSIRSYHSHGTGVNSEFRFVANNGRIAAPGASELAGRQFPFRDGPECGIELQVHVLVEEFDRAVGEPEKRPAAMIGTGRFPLSSVDTGLRLHSDIERGKQRGQSADGLAIDAVQRSLFQSLNFPRHQGV